MEKLQQCKDWILGPNSEGRNVAMSNLVGPGGLDVERFSRAMGSAGLEGLYAFVWTGPEQLVDNVVLKLKGKRIKDKESHQEHEVCWKLADFPEECHQAGRIRYPLYIGKTSTILDRVKQHLHLSVDDWNQDRKVFQNKTQKIVPRLDGYLHKHSTSCQFRSGMQHLYPDDKKADFISRLCNVELCFLPSTEVQDRFYLEDLAIGYFRPWFNVDAER